MSDPAFDSKAPKIRLAPKQTQTDRNREDAAILIQSTYRRYTAKKEYLTECTLRELFPIFFVYLFLLLLFIDLLGSMFKKRTNIAHELLETEKTYVKNLTLLNNVCIFQSLFFFSFL